MKHTPHVLWIPSWYTQKEKPLLGSFFKEQAFALKKEGLHLGLLYPEIRPLKEFSLKLLALNYFQKSFAFEEDIPTVRMHGWNLHPGNLTKQMHFWCKQASQLFDEYFRHMGKPDILHAQSCLWAGIAARELSKKHHIPYFITEHRDGFVTKDVLGMPCTECWSTPYVRDALDNAQEVIAVSEPLKTALGHYTRQSRIQIIPNSIDTDLFCPPARKREHPRFRFLTVCYLEKRKNVSLLLKAFKRLYEEDPEISLDIGGSGEQEKELEKLTESLEIRHAVRFLGPLNRPAVVAALQEADAFVLPSLNESFGVVCIEALATGIPVISTRCGGPEGIVTDDVGILVANDDMHALYKALKSMKEEFDRYDPQLIRSKALRHFSQPSVAKRHIELYLHTVESLCVV